jgi:hypothetical protein
MQESLRQAILGIKTIEEYREAITLFKHVRGTIEVQEARTFVPGDQVQFESRHGGIITGTVDKVNTVTVAVKSTTGIMWKVSPGLLKRAPPTQKTAPVTA